MSMEEIANLTEEEYGEMLDAWLKSFSPEERERWLREQVRECHLIQTLSSDKPITIDGGQSIRSPIINLPS